MARTLQDFVDAAINKGSIPENPLALRKMIQDICGTRRSTQATQEIIDDIIEELEYLGMVSNQPRRKTTRYFPRPIRAESKREEHVLKLAKIFVKKHGRSNAFAGVQKSKGSWAFQESAACRFLDEREDAGKLSFTITLNEFMSAIRSLNAQKAVATRLTKKRTGRKKKPPTQLSLL